MDTFNDLKKILRLDDEQSHDVIILDESTDGMLQITFHGFVSPVITEPLFKYLLLRDLIFWFSSNRITILY